MGTRLWGIYADGIPKLHFLLPLLAHGAHLVVTDDVEVQRMFKEENAAIVRV
jgi:hypothetical protein